MFNSKHEWGKEGSKKRMKTFRFKSFPCNSLATSPRHDCEPSRGGGVVQIEFARGGGDENSLSMINSRDFAVSLFRYYSSSLPHFSLSLSQLSRPFSVPFFFFSSFLLLFFAPSFFNRIVFKCERQFITRPPHCSSPFSRLTQLRQNIACRFNVIICTEVFQ